MLFLFGGMAILSGLLLLGYLFVNADPARLARVAKWLASRCAVVLVALVVVTEGRFACGSCRCCRCCRPCGGYARCSGLAARQRGRSTVETPFIRMSLDHESGAMSGMVLPGRFAGMRFGELGRAQLIDLLRECRADDEEGARLVEAYLDRATPIGVRRCTASAPRGRSPAPPRGPMPT